MPIKHVIIVVQENMSFDNLFHAFPGADTVDFGYAHDGTKVRLEPVSLAAQYDIRNSYELFAQSYDHGKMDGYDLRPIGPRPGAVVPLPAAQYPQYAFVPRVEVAPYWDLAQRFVLADRMFQSNVEQSFAAHLYLIAGQADRIIGVPNGRPWGCDAPPKTTVRRLRVNGRSESIFPCLGVRTLADELNERRMTWAYYAPRVHGYRDWKEAGTRRGPHRLRESGPLLDTGELWSAYDAIAAERFGPDWIVHVVSPSSAIFRDIRNEDLPSVSWVVPDWRNSDHPFSRSLTGPSWIASIVNEVGRSRYWKDTAILVTWDDSGGWYDHVPPPRLDEFGLGPRVPLLVVSAYAKHGIVSHEQFEFGSILHFTESVFSLGALSASDRRAADLLDVFDFDQTPTPFAPVPSTRSADDFLLESPSSQPPDDD